MPDNAALDMGTNSKPQPALSATSDLPTVKSSTTDGNGGENGTVDNSNNSGVDSASAAPEGENTDASATSDNDSGANPAAEPRHKGGFQKRIDQLTKEREEARREKEDYARRLDEALKLASNRQPNERTSDRTEATHEGVPKREDFDSPDDFAVALADWSTKNAIKNYETTQAQKAAEEKAQGEFQKVLTTWHEGMAKAVEKHPDFESVAMNPDNKIAEHVGMALLHVDNGHDVLYWLGQNPSEAARISALGAPHAAIEIGRLSQRLATPAATSKAPAPPSALSSSRSNAASVAPEDDPNYMESRLAEMRKRNR